MCLGTATLNLNPDPAPTGMHHEWDVKLGGSSITGFPGTTAPVASNFATAGSYTITMSTVLDAPDPAACTPDNAVYTLNVLPDLSASLGAATNSGTYCTSSGATSATTLTASSVLPAYATDLETETTYTVTQKIGAGAATPVTSSDFGTIGASSYTLTTTVVGEYKITATVKYKQTASNTLNPLINSSGCPKSSNEITVTVTAKPTKPTITFSGS
ncbi:MAG: hypothetical protein EON51_16680 [Acinetobacter sp.]|nr:MAG: hypothetical protein EON51_16680 [Acinetobacter sp.]